MKVNHSICLLIFMVACLLNISCENKKSLTLSKATKILKEYYSTHVFVIKIPKKIEGYVTEREMNINSPCTKLDEWNISMQNLLDEGFIIVKLTSKKSGFFGGYNIICEIMLTEKAEQYEVNKIEGATNYELIIGVADNIKVTRFTEPGEFFHVTMSLVYYQYEYIPSPVGYALKHDRQIKEAEAYFALYNDGWRINDK